MNLKRILIVNIQTLLMGGTEILLRNNGNLAVVSIYPEDLPTLILEIEHRQPDVIIMDEATYFVEPVHLLASLSNIPNVRLIILNNREVLVSIYEKYERAISHPSQLMDVIELNHSVVKTD